MSGRRISRIDELNRDIPPSRDLWPAIATAIEAGNAGSMPEARRSTRRAAWMPALGLAASVALVAVGVLIGRSIGPHDAGTVAGNHPQTVNPVTLPSQDEAGIRHAAYVKQRDVLLTEVQARLKSMPPAERAKVAASLATLRRSITEIEAELGRDPANALLQELLVNSCQEEMRALTAVRDSGREEI